MERRGGGGVRGKTSGKGEETGLSADKWCQRERGRTPQVSHAILENRKDEQRTIEEV